MQLQQMLYTQGFGTRRVCAGLVQLGALVIDGVRQSDATAEVEPQGLQFAVQGVEWAYHERAYVMLHKPAGTECSHKPSTYPSVYSLLPAPLRQRPCKGPVQGVQAVGRLDQDTTGLLLLTDDGKFLHRMSSPKHHVPKVYEVGTRDPVEAQQVQRLQGGVVLHDDPNPVRASACLVTGSHSFDLTLTQGKYHQVKRMVAAVGNLVTALHRSRIGNLTLPDDLGAGQWRWLTAADLAAITGSAPETA